MKILKLIKGQLVAMQMIVMLWAQTQVAIRLMKLEKKKIKVVIVHHFFTCSEKPKESNCQRILITFDSALTHGKMAL